MVAAGPAIYEGTVRHRRFAPTAHAFEYGLFMSWLDIDTIDEAMGVSRLTSRNGWGLATFDDRDHIGRPDRPLRERLQENAAACGHQLPGGPVYLLTHLRYAGYVFNPISLYYCFDPRGSLHSVLADVRNTYGGRRSYWLAPSDTDPRRFRSIAAKSMYVSPFMEGEVDYEFVLTPPADTLITHMNVTRRRGGDRLFDATLQLSRRAWTAGDIHRTLWQYPLMTAKVIGAIHLEAMRLRMKGLKEIPAPEGRL